MVWSISLMLCVVHHCCISVLDILEGRTHHFGLNVKEAMVPHDILSKVHPEIVA